jgi:hypothetical protein
MEAKQSYSKTSSIYRDHSCHARTFKRSISSRFGPKIPGTVPPASRHRLVHETPLISPSVRLKLGYSNRARLPAS